MMSITNDLMHDFSTVFNSRQDYHNPKMLSKACQWGKVAAVATAIFLVVTAFFSGPIGMFCAGIGALAFVDGYRMLDNIQTIADQDSLCISMGKGSSSSSESRSYGHVTKGTLFARPFFGLAE